MADYIEDIMVGAVDILGISKLLEHENGTLNVSKQLFNVWKNTTDIIVTESEKKKETLAMFEKSIKFGDSIYFFSNPKDNPKKQIKYLLLRINSLVMWGLYGLGILFRAGIAKGDLIIDKVEIPMIKGADQQYIYIGNSMSRANYLEKNQKWIGGLISGDIDCSGSLDYLIELSELPSDIISKIIDLNKIEVKYRPKYAINWLKLADKNRNLCKIDETNHIIDSISDTIGKNQKKDDEKIQNTKNFVDYIFENKLYE